MANQPAPSDSTAALQNEQAIVESLAPQHSIAIGIVPAGGSWRAQPAWSRALHWAVAVMLLAGFVYTLSFTYGWPLNRSQWAARSWMLHPF